MSAPPEPPPAPPDYTSVPDWAIEARVEEVDSGGLVHTVLAVGPEGESAARRWLADLEGRVVQPHHCLDADSAVEALEGDLATALVGHRVLVAGTAQACLAVRAAAVRRGLLDEELRVAVTSVIARSVWCVHCGATTDGECELEDVTTCRGCRRSLLVYPHVSRRSGAYLGFMVDAEKPVAEQS